MKAKTNLAASRSFSGREARSFVGRPSAVKKGGSFDRTISADRLAFEDRGYILSRGESAGGRGLNASQVLHSFGAPTLAITARRSPPDASSMRNDTSLCWR